MTAEGFDPPAGVFLVGWVGDGAVACGGVPAPRRRIAEIKRMYVSPAHRGHGLRPRVLDGARGLAARAPATRRLMLETGTRAAGGDRALRVERVPADREFGYYGTRRCAAQLRQGWPPSGRPGTNARARRRPGDQPPSIARRRAFSTLPIALRGSSGNDHDPALGSLYAASRGPARGPQHVQVELAGADSLGRYDDSHHRLAEVRVGQPEDGRLAHRGSSSRTASTSFG